MRHLARAIPFLLTVAVAPPAAAQDCAGIAALLRVHTAQQDWLRYRTAGQVTPDMLRLDGDEVRFSFRGTLTEDQVTALAAYADAASDLAELARRSDLPRLAAALENPETRAIFNRAGPLLAGLACDSIAGEGEPPPGRGGDRQPTERSADVRQQDEGGVALGLGPSVTQIALGTLAAVLGGALYFAIWRLRMRNQRRRRRFAVNGLVRFRKAGTDAPVLTGRLVDLSGVGVKLRHYGQLPDSTHLEIELLGQWHRLTVRWDNKHYVGMSFDRQLRFSAVLRLLAEFRDSERRSRDTKTAPEKAPST